MVNVTIFKEKDLYIGFEIKGHSDYGSEGNDIVCSAISSAAILTANNITDFFNIKADVTVQDGFMKLTSTLKDEVSPHIKGLCEHLLQIEEQYKKMIKVKFTEV